VAVGDPGAGRRPTRPASLRRRPFLHFWHRYCTSGENWVHGASSIHPAAYNRGRRVIGTDVARTQTSRAPNLPFLPPQKPTSPQTTVESPEAFLDLFHPFFIFFPCETTRPGKQWALNETPSHITRFASWLSSASLRSAIAHRRTGPDGAGPHLAAAETAPNTTTPEARKPYRPKFWFEAGAPVDTTRPPLLLFFSVLVRQPTSFLFFAQLPGTILTRLSRTL